MRIKKNNILTVDKYIYEALYNKSSGFLYEKENFTDFKNKIKHILNNIDSKEIYLKKVNAKKNSKNYTIFYHYKELSKLL